ncbi:hypothetical protein ASE59_02115 [Sphingomonas sp. Leaf10]|nr:hypothetical protein ASE59_02115 [Sphingomonas sp. Leaf10]
MAGDVDDGDAPRRPRSGWLHIRITATPPPPCQSQHDRLVICRRSFGRIGRHMTVRMPVNHATRFGLSRSTMLDGLAAITLIGAT